ncbi:GvpL/GvpF family gas vesicle protein [Streptomyces sp. NPDC048644]|uniref:GvpL/GvpF family gas vesicle protein n=1 Tax=Streptomyces sp. NPDC048644 TaxID=3365582 RepID=UPI0037211194
MSVTQHRPVRSTGNAGSSVTYVFAVCGPDRPGPFAAACGHTGGGPLRLLSVGPLWAVVQNVPAATFSETALRQRLTDAAELERCARAHHDVVTAAAAGSPTVPLPLATLYLADERAAAALAANLERFRAALARVAGRVEWGVKVYVVQSGTTTRPATSAPPETSQPGSPRVSGRDYLSRLRHRQHSRELDRENALAAAERVDRAIREMAAGSVRHRLHGPEATGRDRTQVMNAAYLIAEEGGDELATTIRQLRGSPGFDNIEIEVSGPWAPYSFTEGGELAGHQ